MGFRYGPRFGTGGAGSKVGYDPLLDMGRHFSLRRPKPGTLRAVLRAADNSVRGHERSRRTAVVRGEYEAREVVLYAGAKRALAPLRLALTIFNGSVEPAQTKPLVERKALLEVIEKLAAIIHRAELMMGGQ